MDTFDRKENRNQIASVDWMNGNNHWIESNTIKIKIKISWSKELH